VRIKWARSATRHRITRKASAYVARNAPITIRQPAPPSGSNRDERIVFLGPDENGVMLEVMAVPTDQALVIIHAMPIRDRYRMHLESQHDDQEGDRDA
jgi:hypothetical protein